MAHGGNGGDGRVAPLRALALSLDQRTDELQPPLMCLGLTLRHRALLGFTLPRHFLAPALDGLFAEPCALGGAQRHRLGALRPPVVRLVGSRGALRRRHRVRAQPELLALARGALARRVRLLLLLALRLAARGGLGVAPLLRRRPCRLVRARRLRELLDEGDLGNLLVLGARARGNVRQIRRSRRLRS